MRILQANGTTVSAAHLIVLTFGAVALLLNTALPYLGYGDISAPCTLVLASLFVIYLVVKRPLFSVSLLYMMVLALTAFVAGVGIESGGLMTETGVQGEPNGAFSRLLIFYVIFIGFAMIGFRRYVGERSGHVPVALITLEKKSVTLGFALALAIIGAGVAAGATEGFALLKGVNRYALRNQSTDSDSVLFNLFLNNQMFLALLLGALATSKNRTVKWFAILLIIATAALDVLHGEQFMSVLHFGLTVLTPIVAILVLNGKPVLRYVVVGAVVALVVGGGSVLFAYQGQGLDANETLTSRSLLQGQVWYVVDYDAGLFTPPPAGGRPAFTRFVRSLATANAPSFDDDSSVSGLREVMLAYGVPQLMKWYIKDNISFTMGQMAVPVFWFGLVGGALFVAFTGTLYGALCALQIALAMRGGVVMLWLIVKVLTYASFGIQQGEYWSFFGVRALFYIALTLLWWIFVDSRATAQKMKQLVLT
jgi:hypothetical protein